MEVFQGWGPLKEFPRLLGKKKRKRQILWCAVVSRCFTVSFGRYFNGASASSADQGRGSFYWMKRERIWILALLFTVLQMFMQPAPEQWATSILPSHPAPRLALHPQSSSALQMPNRRQEGNEPSVRARAACLDHIFPASSAGDLWHTELPSLIWAPEACSIQSRIATPGKKWSRSFSYSKNLPRR